MHILTEHIGQSEIYSVGSSIRTRADMFYRDRSFCWFSSVCPCEDHDTASIRPGPIFTNPFLVAIHESSFTSMSYILGY
jgi:hypothetical protein